MKSFEEALRDAVKHIDEFNIDGTKKPKEILEEQMKVSSELAKMPDNPWIKIVGKKDE